MERPKQFRFTINDYERILEKEILSRNESAEFIRGELFCILPTSESHNACNLRLRSLFLHCDRDLAAIIGDAPIRMADSAPRPDLALLTRGTDCRDSGMPSPAEVLLVVEVADETLEYDREVKGGIYAENGIAEYWIVNLIDNCVEVYRDPQPDGIYVSVEALKAGESITLAKLPCANVAIADILP